MEFLTTVLNWIIEARKVAARVSRQAVLGASRYNPFSAPPQLSGYPRKKIFRTADKHGWTQMKDGIRAEAPHCQKSPIPFARFARLPHVPFKFAAAALGWWALSRALNSRCLSFFNPQPFIPAKPRGARSTLFPSPPHRGCGRLAPDRAGSVSLRASLSQHVESR